MNGVWVATMESESYSWTAVGQTKFEAVNAIVTEWNEGRGSSRRDTMSKDELEEYYGIRCDYYEFGKCQWC